LIAASLGGWDEFSLFGFNRYRGLLAQEHLGLIWRVEGGAIVQLSRDHGSIDRAGSPRTVTRKPFHPAMQLPWALNWRPRRIAPDIPPGRHWVRG
jgi:hypothetical protein